MKGLSNIARYRSLRIGPYRLRHNSGMNPGPSPQDDLEKDLRASIKDLNTTIEENPQTAPFMFLTIRNLTWLGLVGLFGSSYFDFGSELALGYLVAKATGKFRQPANVALAAALSYRYPILSEVKVSSLLTGGVVMPPDSKTSDGLQQKLQQFVKMTSDPIDKYGFSYFLSGRINVFATIASTGLAFRYGFNVTEILTSLGVSESLQAGGGAMGAATLTNIILLPVHLAMLIYVTPLTGAYAQLIQTLIRKSSERRRKYRNAP
jgi:hypothetical protein